MEHVPAWLGHGPVRIPLVQASAHFTHGVLRVYRNGEPWLVPDEGVEDSFIALDFEEEIRRRQL